ncbi:MAG: histidine kinase [Segetibacter sp.]|nr:histidine kinase [Bacteroidota bacterium]MCW3111556.1 histidine kinase [Segetibacter sp.]
MDLFLHPSKDLWLQLMKKRYSKNIFFITLFLFAGNFQLLKAGNPDSLKQVLKYAKEDTNKVNTLIVLCSQKGQIDGDESLKYSKQALDLSTKLNYQQGKIKACIHLAQYYSAKGEYEQALKFLTDALKFCAEIKEKGPLLAKVNVCIAAIYSGKGDYNKSLKLYLSNINILDKTNQKPEFAKALYNISIIYYYSHKLDESKIYALRSKALFEELKDTVSISTSFSLLGAICYDKEDYSAALVYYKKSLEQAEKLKDKSYLAVALNGIGIVYADTKEYSEAIVYLKKALAVGEEIGEQQTVVTCLLNLGICYSGSNNQTEAIKLFNQALTIAKKIGSKHSIKELYYFMTEAHEKQGNFKAALASLQQFTIVNDSIYNEENSQQINELSAKYESEKKAKEIAILNKELITKEKDRELLNAQVQQKNSIVFGTIVGTIFLVLILILLFNRKRLIQYNKYQANMNLQREKNAVDILHAQENEQVRIAKDLHDGVGTYLSTLKINLQLYEGFVPKEKTDGYQNALNLIDVISIELRNIMKNLSNETLHEHGLITAFEELVSRVNNLGVIQIDFYTHGLNKRLNEVIESNLYRIGQELITNCVKYSKGSHATLQLLADDTSTTLMLEDNGVGFDAEKVKDTAGMGIKNINDRVSFIKGTARFESNSLNGTLCFVEIPNFK